MYERRRSKKPPAFQTGGVVPAIDEVDIVITPEEMAAAPTGELDDALRQVLEAQRHAEEIARQRRAEEQVRHVQIDPVGQSIDTLTGLSEHKRSFLKRNRSMLDPANVDIMQRVYSEALRNGIADDTPEMDQHILDRVNQERQVQIERVQQAAASAASAPPPPLSPPPALAAPPRAPEPAVRRRSVPVSAPVSREAPTSTGRRDPPGQITLSPEERQIARNSFGPVNGREMSNTEKERLYAVNKAKYQRMIASGEYSPQDR